LQVKNTTLARLLSRSKENDCVKWYLVESDDNIMTINKEDEERDESSMEVPNEKMRLMVWIPGVVTSARRAGEKSSIL